MLDRILPAQNRVQPILSLGLPIMGGMLTQSLMNVVDAAMVGQLGEVALAGVGIGGYACFITISVVIGLSASVQALVARRSGEGRDDTTAIPLNGGLLLALAATLPIALLFAWFAPNIIGLLNQDPEVIAVAVPYTQIRMWGLLAIGMNFCFRGYWNGMHQSMVYMRILILVQVANVAISYVLIFGKLGFPALGSNGAAYGTNAALILGTLIYLAKTYQSARGNGFLRGLPDRASMLSLIRLALPYSIQQVLFAVGIAVMFKLIGMIGSDALAVSHVLINIELLLIMPAVGLGMAATTLVSHALGRKEPEDAYRWGWDVAWVGSMILFLCSLPLWVWPELILGIFLPNPESLALGVLPLRLGGITLFLSSIGVIFNQALSGAGANKQMMKISLALHWGFLLPGIWLAGPYLGMGLLSIWLLVVAQRLLSSIILTYIWHRRQWIHIKV